MRTTVTLEPDLVKKIKDLAHRQGKSFKQALNDLIRRGLRSSTRPDPVTKYTVETHSGGFRPGIDARKLNQLVDELEVEDFIAKTRP